MINRNKIRILQIANLLFPQTSDKIRNECLKEFWLVSQERNIVPIRKMVDIFGMQLFMRYSNEFITEEHFWDPLFDQLLTLKSEFGLSSLFIMYQLYQKIEGDPKRIFIEKFYRFLLACLTTTNTGVKKVAQFIMKELLDKAEIQVSGMETLNKYFEKSRDACLNIEQVKSHLSQFNLDSSLSELFEEALKDTDLSFDPSYAIVPLDILQQISQILLGKEDEITSRIQDELELKLNQKSKINLKENSKEKIKKDAKEELNENSKEKTKKDAKQKISPWEQISSEFINLEIEERRKNYETRKKQNIIVCGSLLARTPNLGGLTRTCEIFNAEMLTINDMQVTKDPEFQKISVGAERWISIKEVKMESLPQFFQQKRQEGFVIIGLEQTNDSKLLSDFEFPQKVVIVVGHEKEGIPSSLMDLMDLCLEIPQFGVIRSLNAHVSTSIAIWEFTNQSLKRTQNNLN
ncbi:RNA methyltransferase [Anaeramoeba ignava]|uniref:RNA methyltransferase n=1 Tax=Anaeramoeba ignava TaxID=1746090 RepID=A0A9Q0LHQ5_ANAIG|nr:RNA methyltransferase [Anaeramoeba ignava]